MDKIALVTPLRDEIDNLPLLVESIEGQSLEIYLWVIVQNGSTDGSIEYLSNLAEIPNVSNLVVLNRDGFGDSYALGNKYSSIVNSGFEYIEELVKNGTVLEPDFMGILDADCFPTPNYYLDLVNYMSDRDLGISSGKGVFPGGVEDGEASDWVRGNCRLWTRECFLTAGYYIGPSADTLSLAKAEIMGFKCAPNLQLQYNCREMGGKSNYEYYGYANYYRGISFLYALIKSLNYIRVKQYANSFAFMKGYLSSYLRNDEKVDDKDILNYFSGHLRRKLQRYFGRFI